MIIISINRNKDNQIDGFEISGHANADEPGKDIVCAAVSALSQTTLLGLHEVAGIDVAYEMQHGYLRCQLPDMLCEIKDREAQLLLETMVVGFKSMEKGYSKYIELHDKEV
jgi:uncharacterized protein YsxB (DUF464 family)